ncbi:MAG: glycosyltransferase family 39 protein [Gammaproteobacteria bacterium]|nr:glycosyltransferase family 39 protein [Gammaproteobacteria bacterium]MDH3406425.1 glycosyltransferase family 39 protein [Gammaproteobacteria bacterium]
MTSSTETVRLQCVLVTLVVLAVMVALFVFRHFDDNRLVSWQWVYGSHDLWWPLLALILALPFAYLLASVSWTGRGTPAILGITAFAASVLSWSAPETIVDAARYFVQAKFLEQHGFVAFLAQWGHEIPAWTDLPLIPFLYGVAFSVVGETRIAIQGVTALLFAGTVMLTFRIGATLWDRAIGATAAVLLLAMPYLWTQLPLTLVDVPTMFFFTLAVAVLIAALEHGGLALLAAAILALAAALLTKYSAWLVLAVLPGLLLHRARSGAPLELARISIVALGALMLVGGFLAWKADVVTGQLALLWSYQIPALGRWEESLASTFLFQIHPFISVAALAAVAIAITRRDTRLLIPGLLVLTVLALEIKRARYVIIILPMLALMAAYGLGILRETMTRRFVAAGAVAASLIVAVGGYLPFLHSTSAVNLAHAGTVLDTVAAESLEVVVLPSLRSAVNPAISVPLLDLYTHKRLVYRSDLSQLPRPNTAGLAMSPVRFTWEVPVAAFHAMTPHNVTHDIPVAVIISAPDQPLPWAVAQRLTGYRLAGEFLGADKVFHHQTLVRIYVPA